MAQGSPDSQQGVVDVGNLSRVRVTVQLQGIGQYEALRVKDASGGNLQILVNSVDNNGTRTAAAVSMEVRRLGLTAKRDSEPKTGVYGLTASGR
jgi:hypothetical protein